MNTLEKLATAWVAREKYLGIKGKAADKAALEFMVGAAIALRETESKDAAHINTVALIVAVRGAFELRHIAAKAKEAA